MKKLTSADIIRFSYYGNDAPVKVITIREELLKIVPSTGKDPAADYVLEILNTVIAFNAEIDTFSRRQGTYLITYKSVLDELNEKIINTVDATLRNVDIDQINISNPKSKQAAEMMIKLLEIHHQGFYAKLPRPNVITVKQDLITNKIDAYTRSAGSTVLASSLNPADISRDVDNKRTVTTQLEQEWRLNDEEEYTLGETSLEEEKTILTDNTVTDRQRIHILLRLENLLTCFFNKIKELENRREQVSDDEKKGYTPAITDANTLMTDLKMAMEVFKKTGDLATFTQTTSELFNEYQNKESFKTNRSNPWFRTFVSKPFELLILFINQISEFIYQAIYGSGGYKGTLFNPSETDTVKKFRAFRKDVEKELDNESLRL